MALALFVSLPFIGFYYGYNYSQNLCRIKYQGLVAKPKDNSIKMSTFPRSKQDSVLPPKDKAYVFESILTDSQTSFSIKILPGWTVSQEQTALKGVIKENKIKIHKDNYSLTLSQSGFSEAKCSFPDTQIKLEGDIEHTDFADFSDSDGNFYRRALPANTALTNSETVRYNVCQYFETDENRSISGYYLPTQNYEFITVEAPKEQQREEMGQIDIMLSSLKIAKD